MLRTIPAAYDPQNNFSPLVVVIIPAAKRKPFFG
jgi:hypothetical protein